MRHYALCFATWLLHTFSTVLLIKAGDTDHVFDFFTNIEPTLVGGRDCVSLILKVHFFHWVLGKLAVL
jgi:hypothetical protein